MTDITPRRGMPSPKLSKQDFRVRFLERFRDPAFEPLAAELDRIVETAWEGYSEGRKAPRTRKAGPEFADPDYDLSVDWLAAREEIRQAQARHEDAAGPSRFLIINGSSRSEHTCPGEMSKSWRMAEMARLAIEGEAETTGAGPVEVKVLDLSRLASEFGRQIHPCKACFSTSPALCHWPCSCYPNYATGQVNDWMNEIYPMWIEAHGVMIITPVNWYQTSSPLKLMIDRLVCADGANDDPTLTHGKDAEKAKALELAGWDYHRRLEGRFFAVVAHGDVEGAENVRRSVSDWLCFTHMTPAGAAAELDRYIGYWEPYSTSHEALDRDLDIQAEVRIAALTLWDAVQASRTGAPNQGSRRESPRQK